MDAWQVNLVCLLEILLRLDFKVFQPHLKNMKDFHPKYNAKCNLSKLTDHDNTPNLPLLLAALLGLGGFGGWMLPLASWIRNCYGNGEALAAIVICHSQHPYLEDHDTS